MNLPRLSLWIVCLVVLTACSSPQLREDIVREEPSYASPPAQSGELADMAEYFLREHGSGYSGFHLLDGSYDSLAWRLALIDSATTSLDIQTYLWYPDHSGRLVLQRAIDAALRGVRVRLVVDDLLTIGQDQLIFELDRLDNVEVRLFNPWGKRNVLSRGGEMVAQFERLNTRMHDKLLIADGRAAVVGGRNIGDHYFGLSDDYNFHDLDVLGFGHIALQSNDMFDHFWNSEWVVSARNLNLEHDPGFFDESWTELRETNAAAPELSSFGASRRDWTEELAGLRGQLHPGTSELLFDTAVEGEIEQNVAGEMFNFMGEANEDLLITNAYIIPGQGGIDFIRGLTDRGVRVRILTNSLASHDVPAVNSHYKDWRDDFILAGAELYEFRADAAVRSLIEVPPSIGEFVGLHTKAFVLDGRKSFIGSMNFDPRSWAINTEAGAFIDSPGLAADLTRLMERDMEPINAWRVLLDDEGKPYWVNSDETVYKQPARGGTQRIMDKIFKIFPKEQY
jgi:putative cardiolipin synthase